MPDTDPDKLKQFSLQVFGKLEGAFTAGMIHLGDQLGLYAVLRTAERALTTDELADAAGLHERWVREWAHNQGAASLLDVQIDDDGIERYSMSPEAVAVLADPADPSFGMGMFHHLPQTIGALTEVTESFRTGIGYDYDARGPEGAIGTERGFAPWNTTYLVPTVLPLLDGVVDRLRSGVEVIDIGCGTGTAVLLMAAAFPESNFRGYEISQFALERAEQNKRDSGLTNVSYLDPRQSPMPTDGSVQFATTFDCIHDMTRPQEIIDSIRRALADDGTWLLVDIKARESYAENAAKNPMASMMYGVSVLSCLASALSEPGGAGLGTLGLAPSVARQMTEQAGFTRFGKLKVDHPVNAFFEIRP